MLRMAVSSQFGRGLFLTACLFVSAPTFAQTDTIGVNSAVKGDVTIQSGEQSAIQAEIKEPVYLGDVVNAAQVSSLQVLLLDQTVFTVGPETLLTINEFVYDPNKNNNSMKANIQKGVFRFMSGGISKTNSADISVDTPVASMGVRGTIVEGLIGMEAIDIARGAGVLPAGASADIDGATLFVLRGPGLRNTSINRAGEIAITSAGVTKTTNESGMAIFVRDRNTPPSDPFELPILDYLVFQNALRTQPTSPDSYEPFNLGVSSAPGLQLVCKDGCDCSLVPG